jgi:DnaK suppressor protein
MIGSKSQATHGTAGSLRTQFETRLAGITVQQTFVSQMRQRLESDHTALEAELEHMRSLTGTDDAFSEHAGLGNHMADDATEVFEQEKNLAIQQHTAELLAQVEKALRLIDTGGYGLCENCGALIDRARLETLPYVTLCVQCKAKQERI